jgi:uncharacterized protein YndB with AHSA1/START domain
MKHREIWHEIHINAPPRKVYQAVTDVTKLAHWWTTDTRGKSVVGKKLELRQMQPTQKAARLIYTVLSR